MELFNKELMEKYGCTAFEKQLHFADIVGKMDWNVDIGKGVISFDNKLVFPIQLLGTFSHSLDTWMWSWANTDSEIPKGLLTYANKLKQCGIDNKIDFLTEPQFEIERDDMHYIGLVALGLGDATGCYLGSYGEGTICLTVKSRDIEEKFADDHVSIFTVYPRLISQYEVNHKQTLVNYLNQKKYKVEIKEDELTGIRGENSVKATFDHAGRLAHLNNRL